MTLQEAEDFWHAITVIEAQEMLLDFRIEDWPKLKDSERKKLYKSIEAMAYPMPKSNKGGKLSNAELAKILAKR